MSRYAKALAGIPKLLDVFLDTIVSAVTNIIALRRVFEAEADDTYIAKVSLFLEKVRFEPDGIMGAVKRYCASPNDESWEAVKEKFGKSSEKISEVKGILEKMRPRFHAENPELTRALNQIMVNKRVLVSFVAESYPRPNLEEIEDLRSFARQCNAINSRINTVQHEVSMLLRPR